MIRFTHYALRFTYYASSWRGWLWGISIILILAMTVVAWLMVLRRQKERVKRTCRLEITNQGNVRSRYEVWAEDPSGGLRFDFVFQGAALGAGEQGSRGAEEPGAKEALVQGLGGVKDWAKEVGGIAAELLGTLGMILPRSIGRPFSRAASRLRKGKSSVQRAERVSGQVSRLKSSVEFEGGDGGPTSTSTAVSDSNGARVQTPFVEPGDSLVLDLRLMPIDPYQARRYAFTVTTRAWEQFDGQPVTEEAAFEIEGLTSFERYSPFLIVLAIAMTVLFIVSIFISRIP